MKIYGITGGVASGKSTAAGFFRELGVPVVDADEIARDLRTPGGEAAVQIEKKFGTLDRVELRDLIARDPKARKELEAILHPLIAKESERRFGALLLAEEHQRERHHPTSPAIPPYAIYEAALLVEAGRAERFAGVILVDSSPESRLTRLIQRDGMSESRARQFLDATLAAHPIDKKRQAATHFLENDGTLEELRKKVVTLHERLLRS